MIVAVTAYVPIPDHPRCPDEYHHLAVPLHQLAHEVPIMSRVDNLKDCWLYQYLRGSYDNPDVEVTHSVSDNPQKNSLAYHIVQAQKTEWLLDAAVSCNMQPDVYVWIDYGIFHVPGVTKQIVKDFLKRAASEQTIAIPGCWRPGYVYDAHQPCWRFCGGVMVVPRKYLSDFDDAMKTEYIRALSICDHVSWEVNMLARVEQNEPELPIWWYKADHDASIFTNYRTAEFADRQAWVGQAHL